MKRWIVDPLTSTPDDLRSEQVPEPTPLPGQVRLKVGAMSINARDQMILTGPFGRVPDRAVVPLSDVAGTIDAVGEGVDGWSVGDRVTTAHVPTWIGGPAPAFGPGPGSLDEDGVAAELIIVDADHLAPTPTHLDDAEASTLQVAGVTAWNAVFGAHPVTAGDCVVVIGSGGVSLFAAQISHAVGARVIAVVRGETDDARWSEIGVSDVVSSSEPGWGQRVFDLTGGVAKVINTVGPGIINECMAALGGNGEVAVLGLFDVNTPDLDVWTMIGKQASIRGVAVGSVTMHRELSQFVERHAVRPIIHARVPFDRLPDAFRTHAAPNIFGKVVIDLPPNA